MFTVNYFWLQLSSYQQKNNVCWYNKVSKQLEYSLTILAEQKLDRVLRDKQTLDKQRQDRLISSVSQTLTTAVNTKLDKVVKSEMKNNVLPCEWVEESPSH